MLGVIFIMDGCAFRSYRFYYRTPWIWEQGIRFGIQIRQIPVEGEGGRGQEESVWEAYEVDTIRQKH